MPDTSFAPPSSPAPTPFAPDELARYARQLALPGVGAVGQRRLRDAAVLVVGAGGLGSPALLYLAAAGVGRLGIVDPDVVEASNLHRQPLHSTAAVGRPKVESAAERLRALNPHVTLTIIPSRLDAENAEAMVRGWDVVIDATDTFASRYAASDACAALGVPYVYGSAVRFDGQCAVLVADGAPCYRCLFPEPPPAPLAPSCAEAGVLGVLPGLIGTLQASETLKLLLGIGECLTGRLLLVELLSMRITEIAVERDPTCPACSRRAHGDAAPAHRQTRDDSPREERTPTERTSPEVALSEVAPRELAARLRAGERVALLDVRERWEWELARLPEARLVPLDALAGALSTLDPERELVVYCHHGVRSAWAVEQLRAAGVRHARNLAGGIDRWSLEVDPAVSRY